MKKSYLIIKAMGIGFLMASFFLFSSSTFAQLSGSSYTIDAKSSASSTNYQSFTTFAADLKSKGVSGDVVVNVVKGSGPYTEQIGLTAITGASSSATITINGNGETIQYTATSSSAAHVIDLNGSDWFRFDNLVVTALSSSYGRCFHLRNSADNNIISNCVMSIPNLATSSSSNYNAYVMISNGTTTATSYGDPGEDNQILKNKMSSGVNKGPYAGVTVINESSGSNVHANDIIGNEIQDWRYAGIWTYYAFQQTIKHNEIHNTGQTNAYANVYGMYNYAYNKGGDFIIDSNYIHDLTGKTLTRYWYGIYHYGYYGTGTAKTISISGNRIIIDNDYYGYALYAYGYQNKWTGDIKVNNNYLYCFTTSSTYYHYIGINYMGYYSYYAKSIHVIGNYCENVGSGNYTWGFQNYFYYATPKEDIIVANNIVKLQGGTYQYYGLMIYGYSSTANINILYNTIYAVDYSSSVQSQYRYYLWYIYGCAQGEFKNNITYVPASTGRNEYLVYGYNASLNFANNDWFVHSSANTSFYYGTTVYNSLADFYKAIGSTTEMEIDPMFKDPANGDFTPTNTDFVNKGTPVKGMKYDYYDVTRNATNPDVGAVEFYIDIAVSNLTMINSNECGGYKEDVTVTLTNNNDQDISSVQMAYDINGLRKVSEMVTQTIPAKKSITFTFEKQAEFNFPGTNTINVYLDASDDNNANNLVSSSKFITNSLHGGFLTEGATFPGYYRPGASGGLATNPDVTAPGLKIEYEIENPTGQTNATYGSTKDWTMTGLFETINGTPVSGGTYTEPGSGKGLITFDPPSTFEDSLIFVGVVAHSNSTKCDTTFGRYVYVPNVPKVDFTFPAAVCDGEVLEFKNGSSLSAGSMMTGRMEYFWDFDDAFSNPNTSDLSDPVYAFSSFGVFNVKLNIIIPEFPKLKFSKTQAVVVASKPIISFKVLNACEGEAIKFLNDTKLPVGVPGSIDYDWDFGDNTPHSIAVSPSHTYANAGGYKITLSAISSGCESVVVKNANQFARPMASFTKQGTCNLEDIMFDNKSTISLGNTGFRWDFNDGGISNLENPAHSFTTHGDKEVKLMAISEFGCKDSSSLKFTLNESPKADFTYSDPCNLTATQFSRTGTIPAPPINSIYEWDFNGEGVSTNENPNFNFSSQGIKDVTLIVRSANGCADVTTKTFNVKLQAKASFSGKGVCEGEPVSFTNSSSVAQGELAYEWRFGDGETSLFTSPKHNYGVSGQTKTYLVTLVANVPGGCSDSITLPVTVNAKSDASFTIKRSGRTITCTPTDNDLTLSRNWRFGDGSRSTDLAPVYTYSNVDQGTFQVCLGVINPASCLSEKCENVNIDLLKVDELNASKIHAYPNPSNGKVTIALDGVSGAVSINVHNLLGEVVYTMANADSSGIYTLDLSDVADGIYVVQVNSGTETSTQRITISH